MTRTEELMKLCEEAEPYWYGPINGPVQNFNDEVTPPLFKQLIELVRLQHEAIVGIPWRNQTIASKKAIAAFNKFEQGGE